MKQIIIIGGGAAGFFAAIRCAELAPGAKVAILEKGKEVLGKVKISGGGRCNVTHACFEPRELVKYYPRGSKELLGPFHHFSCGDTIAWFEQRGVKTKVETDGRVFPVTDNSQSIIDALVSAAQSAGVRIRTQQRVDALIPPSRNMPLWQVQTENKIYNADKVLIATGSSSKIWELLKVLGHNIVPPAPSLFTFNIRDPLIAGLEGIATINSQVQIPALKIKAEGPLLITHWGLSGPGILRLSAWGARLLAEKKYNFVLNVNWLNAPSDEVTAILNTAKTDWPRKQVLSHPLAGLPARLWRQLALAAGITTELRWADANKSQLAQLMLQLCNSRLQVTGKSTFKEEFVTAGGVDLSEVNFKTFESKLHPGLYLAGEVLDIDAITGGFNFQAAWTGGWIAGTAMAEE